MIFKRILSNFIDAVICICTFFILFKVSGLEIDEKHADYFYFLAFFISVLLPILTNSNSLGKVFLNLKWNGSDVKLKLFVKYSIYYFSIIPSFSFYSALISSPFFKSNLIDLDKTLSLKVAIILAISDLIIFIISLGKYHILDYILNLSIENHSYRKKASHSLGILYLTFGLLVIVNMFAFKYNISLLTVAKTVANSFYKEQYPEDGFFGNNVFTFREESENVFCPSDPLTFLVNKKVNQKTLYLDLPKHIFNSEYERKLVCVKLIEQSLLNDYFNFYEPKQIRIVLSNVEAGKFLEFYNYMYFYYFDIELPQWGVYGGIQADSITMRDYLQFVNKYHRDKRKVLEKEFNLTWNQIVENCKKDKNFEFNIQNKLSSNLQSRVNFDRIEIKRDSSILKLKRLDFSQAYKSSYMYINYPIANLKYRVNIINLVNKNIFEFDDNILYLKFLREEITNEEF